MQRTQKEKKKKTFHSLTIRCGYVIVPRYCTLLYHDHCTIGIMSSYT